MPSKKRLIRIFTHLHNITEEALAAAMLAAQLESKRREVPSYSISDALNDISSDRSAILEAITSNRSNRYNLYMAWIVERFSEILSEVESIDANKVAEVQRQNLPTKTVLDNKILKIQGYIGRPTSGILACRDAILADPEKVDTDLIKLLGDIAERAVGIRRTSKLIKVPLIRWIMLEVSPLALLTGTIGVFTLGYLIYALTSLPVGDLSAVQAHFDKDISVLEQVWQNRRIGFWEQMRETISIIGEINALVPLFILVLSIFLRPFRKLLLKSNKMTKTIDSWQSHLNIVADRLLIKRPPLVDIKEIKMNFENRTTKIGPVGPGAIVNVSEYMSNVANTVINNVNSSQQSDDVKALVSALGDKIKAVAAHIDPEKAKELGTTLESLSKEMTLKEPRRKWYELSLSGIKEAAEAIGEVGKPILDILRQLTPILLEKL